MRLPYVEEVKTADDLFILISRLQVLQYGKYVHGSQVVEYFPPGTQPDTIQKMLLDLVKRGKLVCAKQVKFSALNRYKLGRAYDSKERLFAGLLMALNANREGMITI